MDNRQEGINPLTLLLGAVCLAFVAFMVALFHATGLTFLDFFWAFIGSAPYIALVILITGFIFFFQRSSDAALLIVFATATTTIRHSQEAIHIYQDRSSLLSVLSSWSPAIQVVLMTVTLVLAFRVAVYR